MNIDRTQSNYISNITERIYTISITAKENKLRSNMKILRQMFRSSKVDASTVSRDVLSGCLWFAVLDRDVASVRQLTKHNVDANFTRSGINMLWTAIIRSDVDIATMLVQGGADVNERLPDGGPSYLHFLATMSDDDDGSLALTKLMIEKGADVNARAGGHSVLQTALMHDAVSFVEELLNSGARFSGADLVLLAARTSKSSALLPMMVNSVDDLEVKIAWVFATLQYLIEREGNNDNLHEITALLKLGLPVLDLDIDGYTLLRVALYRGKIEVVKLLLEYGAGVNKKLGKRSLPLLWTKTNQTLSEPHKLIIKYLSTTLIYDHGDVNDGYLEKIRRSPKMLFYYKECLKKLREK